MFGLSGDARRVGIGPGRAGQQEDSMCSVVALSNHAQGCAVPGLWSPGHGAGLSLESCSPSGGESGSPAGSSLPCTSWFSLPRRETEATCCQA